MKKICLFLLLLCFLLSFCFSAVNNKNTNEVVLIDGTIKKVDDCFLLNDTKDTILKILPYYKNLIRKINIPSTINNIKTVIFSGCENLTDVIIPSTVADLPSYLFKDCVSLYNVTLSENITSIPYMCFSNCKTLESIKIPSKVTYIDDGAFDNCENLLNINVNEDNLNYSSIDGVLYNKDMTDLIRYPEGKKDATFVIPDGVTSIEDDAFGGCSSLISITIPNSVTSIGDYTFEGCSSPKTISIDQYKPFSKIQDYSFPSGITVFWKELSGDIVIPEGIASIPDYAFWNCSSLISITIPNSVTSIEYNAFNGCSSLTSITIPDSVTSIGEWAFRDCSSLTSITIPNSVTSIGDYAFYNCSSLTEIKIDQDKSTSPLIYRTNNWRVPSECIIKWRGEF